MLNNNAAPKQAPRNRYAGHVSIYSSCGPNCARSSVVKLRPAA